MNSRAYSTEHPDLHEAWIKGTTGQELTVLENERFRLMCLNQAFDRLAAYNRFDALELSMEAKVSIDQYARQISESAALRNCWDTVKDNIDARGYGQYVNAIEQAAEAQ